MKTQYFQNYTPLLTDLFSLGIIIKPFGNEEQNRIIVVLNYHATIRVLEG
jgi:hypothetical protein